MAQRFFRIQAKGFSFEDMKRHISYDGGDVGEDGIYEGICAADSVSALEHYTNGWLASNEYDDYEVVVFEGGQAVDCGDGFRVLSLYEEVARFSYKKWAEMLENETAYDLE